MIRKNIAVFIHLALAFLANTDVHADVSCGGHFADSCADCPQGNGAAWCNGECEWANDQCQLQQVQCGPTSMATICSECPRAQDECSSQDCSWMTTTGLCRDAFSDNVRTASVHLSYSKPIARPAWWFQRVVPTALADVSYLASNGHRFGYGWIQQQDDRTGRVLFSVWDQGGCDQDEGGCNSEDVAQTVACGSGVTCEGFGNEGTGRKSFFDTSSLPNENQAYYMVTQAAYLGNRRMEYTGYFLEGNQWRLLSRIQVSTNQGEEWWIDGMYSFVEQWLEIQTTRDRAALFGPSYVAEVHRSTFVQVPSATFSHGTLENHEHVNAWQAGAEWNYAVGIATGGSTTPVAERGDTFNYVDLDASSELGRFQGAISCLSEAASTREAIEGCLDSIGDSDGGSSGGTSPGGESTLCFPGDSLVNLENKGWVPLSTIKIGDKVLVSHDEKYRLVYSFGHYKQDVYAEYLEIRSTKVEHPPLVISSEHMVSTGDGRWVPAAILEEGDTLSSDNGVACTITSIGRVRRKGIFAPLTESGSIVVNGIVASTYIAFQHSEFIHIGGIETPWSFQWMAHTFEAGHRLACRSIPTLCSRETYSDSGISHWLNTPIKVARWILA
ncbi:Domain of unknown function (DUF3472) [Seminavis robusta]|uniref:Hint domain-containing protein n=1 Tax=Seminavis robusta TaxID=568900 RepID=A0A9N8HIV5_9STRA|nr:Domain of unknown function (DUF3472) [Seminavis robusta]|eukprot:Sro619_g176450.1 Domain of unknown function (DUF3472) (612) ;mRNA; r:34665-36500